MCVFVFVSLYVCACVCACVRACGCIVGVHMLAYVNVCACTFARGYIRPFETDMLAIIYLNMRLYVRNRDKYSAC